MIAAARLSAMVWWYALVPAVLTAIAIGVVPEVQDSAIAEHVQAQPVIAIALGFLVFSAVVRAWSDVLPAASSSEPARSSRYRAVLIVLAIAVAAAAGIAAGRAFQPARIGSTSMVPTLLPGDRVRVDRLAYRSGPPRRGDVVVFHHVRASDSEPGALAKRVIAVAGDHVAMTGSRPVVNGHELATCDAGALIYFGARQVSRGRLTVEWLDGRPYLTVYEPGPHSFAGYDVKPGEVFVLGDNRGVSNDSRSWPGSPAVSLDQIEGRVERVLLGDDRAGRLDGDRLWYALGTDLQLPGVDVTPLRAGIEHCLREPPPPWR